MDLDGGSYVDIPRVLSKELLTNAKNLLPEVDDKVVSKREDEIKDLESPLIGTKANPKSATTDKLVDDIKPQHGNQV